MKRNYWPLFFIGIFSFTFGMIVWTIYSATQVPVHEDEAFLKSYHDLDRDFNKVVKSNEIFLSKYNFDIKINESGFGLIINDIFLSQRVLEEKSNHKDIFINGNNNISIKIKDKKTQEFIKNSIVSFRISRPTNHNNTMDFENKDFKMIDNAYVLNTKLPLKGNWNITATFKIGNDVGYLYIKSNAI